MSEGETQHDAAPDEIDYFLAHEEERPNYGKNRTIADAADNIKEEMLQIKASLWELAVTVASSSVKYFTNMALRRTMCLVTVQKELVKDGRLPGPFVDTSGSGGGGGVVGGLRHVVGGFLAVPRCGMLMYRTGGLSALFRGGAVYAGFLGANYVVRSTNGMLLNALAQFLEPHLQSRAARVLWLIGVLPLLMGVASWPLKAVRNLVMTNYMADIVAPVGPSNGEQKVANEGEERHVYLYSGVWELWQTLQRELGGWKGILGHGFEVDLAHTYAVLAMRLAVNAAFTDLYARARRAQEGGKGFLHPVTLALVLNGLAATSNIFLRPFHVVTTRMALLPCPGGGSGGTAVAKEEGNGGVPRGRRYRNGLDCVQTIVREEGVLALWVGTPQILVVNTLVPLAQMLLLGTVRLSFVDFGNGA